MRVAVEVARRDDLREERVRRAPREYLLVEPRRLDRGQVRQLEALDVPDATERKSVCVYVCVCVCVYV